MSGKIVSIILARSGSKGISRKNLVLLKEHPLIYYAIKASLESNVYETWVSTNDKEIADISKRYGALVLNRPDELATDVSTSESALLHFSQNVEFDFLVFIQPTSPLLMASDINGGIAMLSQNDSVFSAYQEHWHGRWNKNGTPIDWVPNDRPRRQDVEDVFVENGAFYITSKELLEKTKLRYSGKIGILEMPMCRSFQIDSLDDLNLIDKLL